MTECPRDQFTSLGSCIADLAVGWILPSDLCPSCTRAFMAALDGIAGELEWHENYVSRSRDDE